MWPRRFCGAGACRTGQAHPSPRDAAIAAWDAKRAYGLERPITAICYLMNGQTVTGHGLPGPAGGLRRMPGEN